jgi:serine/threonine-protein kinase
MSPGAFSTAPNNVNTTASFAGDAALIGARYRLLGRLGRGGMGEVFEAEHVALKKRVVVKLLHARHGHQPQLLDRMRVEAQALALVRHPNLVEVSDFGHTSDGRAYFVMERLYGRTLREELDARGALPPLEVIDLGRQLLAGLAAAHGAGLVHRDVKLDNVFLCDPEGSINTNTNVSLDRKSRPSLKLLDFGLAKVVGAGQRPLAPLVIPTDEGVMLGTPRFFSPEQALGRPVDARADIYSTGALLYAMVAGRAPFDHYTALYELAQAHAAEPPEPPSRYAKQPIPPELERVILKALEKRPEDRFQTAAELADALALASEPAGAPGPIAPIAMERPRAILPILVFILTAIASALVSGAVTTALLLYFGR